MMHAWPSAKKLDATIGVPVEIAGTGYFDRQMAAVANGQSPVCVMDGPTQEAPDNQTCRFLLIWYDI